MKYFYSYSYHVDLLANAGIKYKAENDVTFIPCAKLKKKDLNLHYAKHIYL